MPKLLEVEDLRTQIVLRSGIVHAVDGLSFDVEAGETLGIVGESGCGKTMAAMSIMRLLPRGGRIASGEIRLEGRDLVTLEASELRKVRGNDIGIVFQDPMTSLNPTMTIGRQIAEAVLIHRDIPKEKGYERAAEVLDLVGLPRPKERLKDYPHQLSGGLRQRVMIAMALACDPKLLIADEPTTALDVTIQAQILSLLDKIKRELGMGIILITHDMGVIAGRADRVAVMYAGRKVEMADTAELFKRVRHPYTEALLASIPQLDQDKSQELYSIPGLPPDLRKPSDACRFAPRCAFATEQCRTEDPPLGGEDPDHIYACFHPRKASVEDLGDLGAELLQKAEQNKTLMAKFGDELQLLTTDVEPVGDAATVDGDSHYILEFRDVTKEFPVTSGGLLRRQIGAVHAVTEVSLGVRPGETFGLVGESGCGKTTLGRVGVGLEPATSGQVIFNGTDITQLGAGEFRELRRDLQFMFQDPYSSLDPRMRVREIISEPLDIAHRGDKKERLQAVRDLLGEVGLGYDAIERYPHEFSGGQRQRLGLARALALNPKVIIADEPVSALDVSIRSQILNLMKRLQAAHGLTYIVISHDLSVVRYLADRIGVMYLGRLVETGPANDIYERPAHPYTSGLLDAIPVPNPEIARGKTREVGVKGELPSPIHPPSGCRFRTRCPLAEEICAEVVPPLRPFGRDHIAACHFPLQKPTGEASDVSENEGAVPVIPHDAAPPAGGAAKSPDPAASAVDPDRTA